jgi:hypothetical protein
MRHHPILRGVQPHFSQANNSLYITNPLNDTATPLVYGRRDDRSPAQAFAWINEYKPGSRQFFFTASHPDNFEQPDNQALLYNAVFWALGREVPTGGALRGGASAIDAFVPGTFPPPPERQVPPRAQVLFDGLDLSQWDYWYGGKQPWNAYELDERAHSGEGLPEFSGARWSVTDGAAVASPCYGDLLSRKSFADYRLEFDFLVPPSPAGTPRVWRGNSGVFLNSLYEVQILDSAGTPLDVLSSGAITGVEPPLLDAAGKPGEWQHMQISFWAARYRDGRQVRPATATVVLNDKTVQDNIRLDEPTTWGSLLEAKRRTRFSGPLTGPIRFQADSAPVRFANIWVEPIDPPASQVRELTGQPWVDMNYGPFKTHSLEVYPGNIANKAVAIRVDPGPGGVTSGNEFMLFETDTLRFAAGWTGPEFNDWRNIMHNGEHVVHASIVGDVVFANPDAPGWASPQGEFNDTRLLGRDGRRYGPMDRQVARWKGLYLHGDQVILSYRVGETEILELPGAEGGWRQRAFSRTLNLGPRSHDLIMQVSHQQGVEPELRPLRAVEGEAGSMAIFPTAQEPAPAPAEERRPWISLDGQTKLVVDGSEGINLSTSDFTIFARIRTQEDGTILSKTAEEGVWVPFGKTLFVRDGRLSYDVGWVGVVQSERAVNDGKWHKVAVTHRAQDGMVEVYVDGQADGRGRLTLTPPSDESEIEEPELEGLMDAVEGHVVQLGYTAPDFPTPPESYFVGDLADVRIYSARLSSRVIQNLGRRSSEYQDERLVGRWDFRKIDEEHRTVEDGTGNDHVARIVVRDTEPSRPRSGMTVAGWVGGPEGTHWITTSDGHLRLVIPAGDAPARLKLLLAQVTDAGQTTAFERLLEETRGPMNLKPLTQGGPARWEETVTTKPVTMGDTDGAFVLESITVPFENPYRAWMRTGGFDFFPDGRRAAVCTVMGDMWIVDGLGGEFGEVTWKRIATGMYEPMGVRIVDDQIYVTCRDQITRLHDLNGDGEVDYYEAFSNDNQTSEHFHEFAQCLETDDAGNFYYVKAAGHDHAARFPHHGALLKVSPDGQRTEVLATGFRAPNGLWASPDGAFWLTTDQEGHWTPENRINWIEQDQYHGYVLAYHDVEQPEDDFIPPLAWVHKKYDNSPSEAFFIESKRWGLLDGKMAHLSYGKGKVFHVMYETASNGLKQGGVSELPIKQMPTGLQRCRFNPRDGQMYLLGLFVWCSDQTQPGGFYRVTYTGEPLYMPLALNVAKDGVVIRFTEDLNPTSGGDPGNYSVEMWKYWRRREYGSPDFKVLSQGEGHDSLEVSAAVVSSDRRSVFLEIPGIRSVPQMHIDINIRAADGTRIRTYVHHTIHALGERAGRELLRL